MFDVPVVGWEVHKFIVVKSFIVLSSCCLLYTSGLCGSGLNKALSLVQTAAEETVYHHMVCRQHGRYKALSGGFAAVVKYINASPATVVSIDIPSDVYKRQALFGRIYLYPRCGRI